MWKEQTDAIDGNPIESDNAVVREGVGLTSWALRRSAQASSPYSANVLGFGIRDWLGLCMLF